MCYLKLLHSYISHGQAFLRNHASIWEVSLLYMYINNVNFYGYAYYTSCISDQHIVIPATMQQLSKSCE